MRGLTKKIWNMGILPIIQIKDLSNASKLADALRKGGMDLAEVVFRTDEAAEAIHLMKKEYPELTIGAGTVLTRDQVDQAFAAGATFTVSPGVDSDIVGYSFSRGMDSIPGCATPTEVQMAHKLGVEVVKFFPAAQMGGLSTINAMSAPFPKMGFLPSNGVGFQNIDEYLKNPHVAGCAGIFPCPPQLIQEGKWDEITGLCKKALAIAVESRKTIVK